MRVAGGRFGHVHLVVDRVEEGALVQLLLDVVAQVDQAGQGRGRARGAVRRDGAEVTRRASRVVAGHVLAAAAAAVAVVVCGLAEHFVLFAICYSIRNWCVLFLVAFLLLLLLPSLDVYASRLSLYAPSGVLDRAQLNLT